MYKLAIVLSAGSGRRMNVSVPKQYMELCGKPVLYYSLKAFEDSSVDAVIIVCASGQQEYVRSSIVEKFGFDKVTDIVEGGRERYHSVYNGLTAAKGYFEDTDEGIVLIHDGARPLVSVDIIERTIVCAAKYGACAAGMPSKDTVKIADEDGFAVSTPERNKVWAIQTPQTFRYSLVMSAYTSLMEKEHSPGGSKVQITDDAQVVERFTDRKVKLIEGSYRNMKITTPEDLKVAEDFLKA